METPQKRPNLFVRIVRGIYRAVDSSRRFAMNVIFVLIVILLISAIGSSMPNMKDKTALVIAPRGDIVEQFSSNPVDRAFSQAFGEEIREVQLRDIVRALDAGARDPNIARVVLVPDEMGSAGMATLVEIGAALKRFKAAGKEIVAYGDAMDQRGYYLAAHADRVYLHPDGAILLEGLGRYRTYFKGALDKLGIEARLFRVGEYKSAGEPYIREDQSAEAREADLFWMGDIWQRYLGEVAELRRIDAAKLSADVDNIVGLVQAAGGDIARVAKDQGLVDELRTRDQVRDELIAKGAADEEHHTFRQIGLSEYVGYLDRTQLPTQTDQVAVVVASGEIVDGDQPPGVVGGESTSRLLRTAREDDDVKAVVLRVDSPGGSVFPSELIRREVELTRAAGKPVIVSMGDVAASGGYWISMNADRIIASPSTITGSIGIYGLWFNAPQALAKLGLKTDGVGTTWISGATDPTREYDPRLGEFIQSIIERGYRQFVGKVATARDTTPDAIDKIARGRVWSGAQAKERGLVDQLGTLRDAITYAADQAKLGDDYRLVYVEKEMTPFERFVTDLTSTSVRAAARVGLSLPEAMLPAQTRDDLDAARRLLADAAKRKPVSIYALCECELR
jgi:protease IV